MKKILSNEDLSLIVGGSERVGGGGPDIIFVSDKALAGMAHSPAFEPAGKGDALVNIHNGIIYA